MNKFFLNTSHGLSWKVSDFFVTYVILSLSGNSDIVVVSDDTIFNLLMMSALVAFVAVVVIATNVVSCGTIDRNSARFP
jgi:hypothetical protein